MEKEPHVDEESGERPPPPPPFAPDPDLITHLERGDKPTADQVRRVTEGKR
jgi:hypothetical protein